MEKDLELGFKKILDGNREWMDFVKNDTSGRFQQLAKGQNPEILWIGCADSRVPANEITGTKPGEVFVHRNIANMCVHSDMSMLSVLDYAVNVLKVKQIIIAGHYGCGGVAASLSRNQFGIIDNWLCHIKDVYRLHAAEIDAIEDHEKKVDRLIELNVQEQVFNLCTTSIIQNAWKDRNDLAVHGMVINIGTGALTDLNCTFTSNEDLGDVFSYR
ncbi:MULTISPECIES: carbonic anhydrase [Sphingobacterium]|jgi:carbonic anhydrase|uniref:carbonic anhydrase n=1 Tax=Sphingobacterium TaxID=28453 RepID=UPI0004E5F4AE|nr:MULTISPECIES: carbonic anhydrase [Sphingobacterium]CDS91680.1 Carbonic anhydrase 2 [Sphingobacterium sp. PM2-P1-29]SJN51257.1 Carbonic anhydrase [Sphingobacterium faecium PCAi_F2.5]UPZ38161.1 carbonic anhydrase [Sphingobacterium sp. PCS056]UXD69600.1 carbonic anhydrase [Sphingobacterium faecium]WGQ13149.1 carbonic anhydrase [Sphingobacterium faecium]